MGQQLYNERLYRRWNYGSTSVARVLLFDIEPFLTYLDYWLQCSELAVYPVKFVVGRK